MRRETGDATDRERLDHMLRAARDAIAIAAGRARADVDTDLALQHALAHCVLLIGEAAARVTDAGRARAPLLPWPRVVGMRHILVHAYFKLDYDAVWRVVTEHLPGMVAALEQTLSEWPESPPPASA